MPAKPDEPLQPAPENAGTSSGTGEFSEPVGGPVFYVFKDGDDPVNHWIPGGWMGDGEIVGLMDMDLSCMDKPYKGASCIKFTWNMDQTEKQWAGCLWYDPDKNFKGDIEGAGYNVTGAKKLVFAARGETGKEVVSFGFGAVRGKFGDTGKKEVRNVRLSNEWKEYSIPLDGVDLRRIVSGFLWAADLKSNAACGKKCIFYLDDIRFEY